MSIHCIAIAVALVSGIGAVQAADDPQRPVQISMQYSAGSGPDTLIRHVGDSLSRILAKPLVILNKPGANGWLAAMDVKQAAADGHTLLVTDNAATALQPLLFKSMPFDPVKDFEPVAPLYSTYFFLVVASDSSWKNVGDLVNAARLLKGNLTVGSFGTTGINQVGVATLEEATQTKITVVPYKTLQDMLNDVSAGRVAWAFATAATVAPYLHSKRLRLLAVAAPTRFATYRDTPTVTESGGPSGFELKSWVALFAPKGTPSAVAERIHDAIARAMSEEAVVSYLAASGFERWTGGQDDVRSAIAADRGRFAAIVKKANLQPQ